MSKSHPDAPPTWFRLSEASWAEIAAEYRNGATAGELARKWKVSPTSIYRHACKDGWTKKASSDAVARAHAEAVADRTDPPRLSVHQGWPLFDDFVQARDHAMR